MTRFLLALLLVALGAPAAADEVNVAVAANFTRPAEEIGAAFTARTGHDVVFSFGATGGLYAQITQGAPFDVFLAADDRTPARAVADGFGRAGTAFTYAIGRAVLYGPGLALGDGAAVLRAGRFSHIAIADPATAPYGAAAAAIFDRLGLAAALAPRLVVGQNISQALQFVDSGNAELGIVALSQVIDKPAAQVWRVPAHLYDPIRQNAVLLAGAADDAAAAAFLAFLRGPEAAAIIARYGYETVG
ncbi:molybdate ABC transporter substrate-binding protein [Devosia sp.]|uniref:molybdate ABC transporter substrate-binding protein n=1 Tax=Devosia sp. TaxID=1871048 RepID=UPI002F084DE4